MARFKLWSSVVRSDCSGKCATPLPQAKFYVKVHLTVPRTPQKLSKPGRRPRNSAGLIITSLIYL